MYLLWSVLVLKISISSASPTTENSWCKILIVGPLGKYRKLQKLSPEGLPLMGSLDDIQATALTSILCDPRLIPSHLRTLVSPLLTKRKLHLVIVKGPPSSVNHSLLSMN